MRRLIVIAAAAATLLAPLSDALAQGRGNGRGNGGGRWRDAERAERFDYARENRGRGNGNGRWRDEGPPGQARGRGRDRDFERYEAPAPRGWGRGQYLPPMYREGVVRDPGRFRLRTPPPGYDWVGVGRDIYLVQRSTGRVLDAIPGGF